MNTDKCRLCVDFSTREALIDFVKTIRSTVGNEYGFDGYGVFEMNEDDMKKDIGVTPKNSFWFVGRDVEKVQSRASLKRLIPHREEDV